MSQRNQSTLHPGGLPNHPSEETEQMIYFSTLREIQRLLWNTDYARQVTEGDDSVREDVGNLFYKWICMIEKFTNKHGADSFSEHIHDVIVETWENCPKGREDVEVFEFVQK